jgi:2-polyprenyl-3-methyl-5-hydroxy-6-metoxy-1,4-benzoquinol methylase
VPLSTIEGIAMDEANPLLRIVLSLRPGAKVLDIGTGSGLLPLLASHIGIDAVFDGIEPNGHAAQIARCRYRDFHEGILAGARFINDGRSYDYIVLADVIEHAADPEAFIKEVLPLVGPGCRLLISVPNIAFAAVRIALLNGDFDYVDSGLLERTHLRFFTLKTLQMLIRRCGLYLNRLCLLQRDPRSTEIDLRRYSWRPLSRMARDDLAMTYQFLVELSYRESDMHLERYRASRTTKVATVLKTLKRQIVARLRSRRD